MPKLAWVTVAVALMATGVRADPPRGRRTRVEPTRLVVTETELSVGDATFVVRPGVAVAAGKPRRGKVEVTLAGPVRATGTVDEAALGLRVAADTEIADGRVYEGALVRVIELGKTTAKVESTGAVRTAFELPVSALTVEPREFVYRMPPNRHFVTPFKDTTLYRKAESIGTTAPPVGVIAGGVEVVLVDQQGTLARVQTHGPVEVQGWALARQFADEGADPTQPNLLRPTHEVFLRADLYPSADSGTAVAELRGGALVEINKEQGDRVKVTTTGEVVAAGWVERSTLRSIERSVK